MIAEIDQAIRENDLECEPYVVPNHDVQLQDVQLHVEDDGNNEQNALKKVTTSSVEERLNSECGRKVKLRAWKKVTTPSVAEIETRHYKLMVNMKHVVAPFFVLTIMRILNEEHARVLNNRLLKEDLSPLTLRPISYIHAITKEKEKFTNDDNHECLARLAKWRH